MAWFTCAKVKLAGFCVFFSFCKKEISCSLRNVYLKEYGNIKTLRRLRTDKNARGINATLINFTRYWEFTNQPCRSELHVMATKESAVAENRSHEESCVSDTPVRTNCGKRKIDETEEPATQDGAKKRKKSGKLRPGDRYVPPPKKRNLGVSFSQEHFAETSYYFEDGLRKVYPYYYDFQTYCKGRWIGKTLLEVFKSEFRSEPVDYYHKAVKAGRIRLNETPVDDLNITLKVGDNTLKLTVCLNVQDYLCIMVLYVLIFQNNDFMRNTVHRHEPPVSGKPLEVLVDDGEVVVVDKPASLPVHPCGRYRHNTVIFILGKENGLSGLHTVHRLDRLTSGVLLFARTLEVSKKLDAMVRERQVRPHPHYELHLIFCGSVFYCDLTVYMFTVRERIRLPCGRRVSRG